MLAGIAAGFASSTATIGGMGAIARRDPVHAADAAAAGLASNLGTFVQMTLLLAVGAPRLLAPLVPALVLAAATVGAIVASHLRAPAPRASPVHGRAFAPREALAFLAAVAGVSQVAVLVLQALGEAAVPVALATAGLVDPHASAATAMQLVHAGRLAPAAATDAVACALLANLAAKAVIARATGGAVYARRLVPGLAASAAALAIGWLLARG